MLETVYTCYNAGAACTAPGGSFTLPITSRAVVVSENGYERETVTDYDGDNNPSEVDQYDWGSGGPGGLLRKTVITYAALSGIADRPAEIEIEDGAGNLAAETTYAYDQTALQPTSGLPIHGAAPEGSRGNLTTVEACAAMGTGNACAKRLTTTLSYFDTGEIYQATAPGGAVTTFQYAAGSPGCAGAFPTSVNLPEDAQGHAYSASAAWNCNGGVMTSATETKTVTAIASGVSKTQYALLDGLGRPSFSQTVEGSSCDTVETTYDQDGRAY